MGDVLILHSSAHNYQSEGRDKSLWSYVYPGCIVYHWDAVSQQIANKLDCSKLVPCSESLQSISIEEHLSPSHCQVRELKFFALLCLFEDDILVFVEFSRSYYQLV